ncbi:MAG: histone deacetylase [Cyanobacteria bacterium SZAS LIN-5]|nr:histone deacetylase [Cyanobacteria bacterium SZAS LIN-5]
MQTMIAPLFYSPKYKTDLGRFGIDKPFALDRGELVLKRLNEEAAARGAEKIQYRLPEPISDADVRLVHTAEYLETLNDAATWLDIFEFKGNEYIPEKAVEPLPNLIEDLRLKSGGTLAAAMLSLETGLAASLGGGYHHAFADRGRGYCVINDVAIAIRSMQKSKLVKNVLIVDLDFHQGDGTARIFQNDDSVFTFSVHSHEGWPDEKQTSDLDVPVKESETGCYQEMMEAGVKESLRRFAPDMVLFIAGSDPYEKDVLPGTKFIRLSLEAMKERDFYVIDTFAGKGIPLAMVFAGGYGPDVWEVHYWATRRLLERAGIIV